MSLILNLNNYKITDDDNDIELKTSLVFITETCSTLKLFSDKYMPQQDGFWGRTYNMYNVYHYITTACSKRLPQYYVPIVIKNNMTQNNQNKTVVGDLVTVMMNCFRHGNRIPSMSSLYLVVYWNILLTGWS